MRLLAGVAITMLVAACVVSPGPGEAGGNQDSLTLEEIMDSGMTNLYEAVERLRPRWIRPNTPVYMDGTLIGETDALRDWPSDTALTMEWLAPMVASQRVPGVQPGGISGVIVIRTRSPE